MEISKYQEVEAKYELLNKEEVIQQIEKLHLPICCCEHQKDTYYNSPSRDFLAEDIVSEWLRVRETEEGTSLNYKLWLPVGAKIQNQCKEFESEVEDAFAVKQMLSCLSFSELACVEKKRRTWKYKNMEISIDEVKKLGALIEIEYCEEVPEEKITEVNLLFEKILRDLNAKVKERDRRGYAYTLIFERKKEKDECH